MNESLIRNARAYAAQRQLQIADSLGSGKDGMVFVGRSNSKPARVAIKAHRLAEPYVREKQVYERLRDLRVSSVLGFNVPELLAFDDELRIIEITIVRRPFVLDFAGAHLDKRPDFPEDVWAEWEAEKREQFEGRWSAVQKVLAAFEERGIYLLDVSPGNIGFFD